jgi:hypothetical protein
MRADATALELLDAPVPHIPYSVRKARGTLFPRHHSIGSSPLFWLQFSELCVLWGIALDGKLHVALMLPKLVGLREETGVSDGNR